MASKLNSMRLLEQHKIHYEAINYPDTIHNAVEVAEVLGVPPEIVFKTLVVEPVGGGKPVLAVIPAERQVDLKKLASAMGVKKASMAAHKDAERLTGLKVGGISALALTQKNWQVYLHQSAAGLEHLIMSAGQRGTQLRVPTSAFIALVKARVAEISTCE
ncbi:MAG: aminoacyl-tRNA deacylase [Anaerolineae bacterium]|nr:aminoacyl-tRNA deacylase [Anaerolineae bacterium]